MEEAAVKIKGQGRKNSEYIVVDVSRGRVLKREKDYVEVPLEPNLAILKRTVEAGTVFYDVILNVSNMPREEVIRIAAELVGDDTDAIEIETPSHKFFEFQAEVDKGFYYMKLIQALLTIYCDSEELKNGVYWDEVHRFYCSVIDTARAILVLVEKILKGDAHGEDE